jgi:hypothetical protein
MNGHVREYLNYIHVTPFLGDPADDGLLSVVYVAAKPRVA